jgi:vesicle-associated membrane protein 2
MNGVGEFSETGEERAEDNEFKQQNKATQDRLQQVHMKADEVRSVMCSNVQKILERDETLSELDTRADFLEQGAAQFARVAGKLKKKYWWENLRIVTIIGIIALLLFTILIVLAIAE